MIVRLLLTLFLASVPVLGQDLGWTTVFVVRHAEKQAGDDPDLSEAGRERARRLMRLVSDRPITGLFSSQYKRTRQTLAPLAEAHQLSVTEMPADDVSGLVKRVLEANRGGRVVVASHSNLVGAIVKEFGAPEPGPIAESEYFHLYIVVISPAGDVTAERLHY